MPTTVPEARDDRPVPVDAALPEAPASGVTRRRLIATGAVAAGAAGAASLLPGATAQAAAAPAARPAARAATRSARTKVPLNRSAATLPSAAAVLADGRDLVDHDVVELAALMRAGATTSVEITQAYIDRILKFNGPFEVYDDNGGYNAFVRIDERGALEQAAAADRLIAAERAGGPAQSWLCGIPFGFKDSIGVKGFAAQNGVTAFFGNRGIQDSGPVKLLRDQGVVALGITLCSSYSSSIIGGATGNAWDFTRAPGGSSQGSGCAPVARLVAGTLGEETGGSIMIPSSVNGASAIKPSAGVVPTNGVMPLTPGVDVVGPIMRSGRDVALTFNALAQADPRDPQTWQAPRPFPSAPVMPRSGDKPLAGTTIGIPKTDWLDQTNTDPQSRYSTGHQAVFERVKGELQAMGAQVKEFSEWPRMNFVAEDPFFNSATSMGTVDGTSLTARTTVANANRGEMGYVDAIAKFAETVSPTQRSALLSQYGRSGSFAAAIAYYKGVTTGMRIEAEARRRQLVHNCNRALEIAGVDFMMVMTHGTTPTATSVGRYRTYYQLPNQLGWPMVNLPVGSFENMPVSIAFWGPRFSEAELIQAMVDYQDRYPQWHTARPPDPWGTSARALNGRAALRSKPDRRLSDEEWAEVERKAADPAYSTDVTVSEPEPQQ